MTEQLTRTQVAERLGVTVKALEYHLKRGSMPGPDGYLGRTPYWRPATIDRWAARRRKPGQPSELWTPRRRSRQSRIVQAVHQARRAENGAEGPQEPSEEVEASTDADQPA